MSARKPPARQLPFAERAIQSENYPQEFLLSSQPRGL